MRKWRKHGSERGWGQPVYGCDNVAPPGNQAETEKTNSQPTALEKSSLLDIVNNLSGGRLVHNSRCDTVYSTRPLIGDPFNPLKELRLMIWILYLQGKQNFAQKESVVKKLKMILDLNSRNPRNLTGLFLTPKRYSLARIYWLFHHR